MSKRAIKLWAIVIVISILGVIATYVLLGNNGSSVLQKDAIKEQPATEQNNNISNNSTPQNNNVNSPEDSLPRVINASNNQNEYSLEYLIPKQLLDKLAINTNNSKVNYYYSTQYKLAFKYENSNIDGTKDVFVTEDSTNNTIYVHTDSNDRQSGQSIELIGVKLELQSKGIDEIISNQLLLNMEQKKLCKIEQQNNRYIIIAKNPKVTDSTAICGQYAKGNNRFFIKSEENVSAITKLIFVSAGDKEISFDGSGNSRYWYESVILE